MEEDRDGRRREPVTDFARTSIDNIRTMRRRNRIALAVIVLLQAATIRLTARGAPAVGIDLVIDVGVDLLMLRLQRVFERRLILQARASILMIAIIEMLAGGLDGPMTMDRAIGGMGAMAALERILAGTSGEWDRSGRAEDWRRHLRASMALAAHGRIPGIDWRQRLRLVALVQVMIAIEAIRPPTLRERMSDAVMQVTTRLWLTMRRMTPVRP